jgi:geranylgeranyl diphosphate synthase type II
VTTPTVTPPAATGENGYEMLEGMLARYGELTAQTMAEYLPKAEPRAHLYDLVAEYPARTGKGIRPSLCLASCVAFGGRIEEALPSAAAIELLHNAFLVHDDVEDSSLLRRGQPTLQATHGEPLAINAGDALAVLAQKPLRDNREWLSTRIAGRVAEEFDLMERRTLEGQAIELGWRRDNRTDLVPDDYVDLVIRKTCWYTTIHPLRVGAIIGSWGQRELDSLVVFGSFLGTAFQIADDLLNLTPSATRYGKEAMGDIREGKRTLMLIHLLQAVGSADHTFLIDFLADDTAPRPDEDIRAIYDLMESHGSIDFARRFGQGIADACRAQFHEAFGDLPPSAERQFLWEIIGWMLERER